MWEAVDAKVREKHGFGAAPAEMSDSGVVNLAKQKSGGKSGGRSKASAKAEAQPEAQESAGSTEGEAGQEE